jgi:hypothetical protein
MLAGGRRRLLHRTERAARVGAAACADAGLVVPCALLAGGRGLCLLRNRAARHRAAVA